ncbi:gamma-glutamyltransferase family protein [Chachezhania sediminis]|uniref:gamma-glutamyltransferase family protein n=1 Tax=Chachezhania sediminis TaxID=2599291 RepID=UPI00131DC79F|nr:gamma-glutamyltransferase family protein [Chachezhania sediminis]
MSFTTRPEIQGTFGVVTSTHWIASAVGMAMLERGGNAFDAAVAAGFVLQVVEPHLNGPAGEFPAIFRSAATGQTQVLCAQGTAPAGATIDHYRGQGLSQIPGSGMLATVTPGAFDGWMMLLRDHGTMPLRTVLEPAIHYARAGHPILTRAAATIAGLADFYTTHWPTSAATWMPGGHAPAGGALFANPVLADTWDRILTEAEAVPGRDAQIEAARRAWSQGFVAEAVDAFVRRTEVMDASGAPHRGVLTADDMAGWQASYEAPLSGDYRCWQVLKTGPWGQGPVLLQSLALLEGFDLGAMDPDGAAFIHLVIEAQKLAFADREAYYGDPAFVDVPLDTLLSAANTTARQTQIGAIASMEQRPSLLDGYEALTRGVVDRAVRLTGDRDAAEPTMAHLSEKRGDTVHLDVIDKLGNMISVTPSGGWLQSSPVIPELGFCLNSRAQMFWLEDGLNQSLRPGARPRTTLTPSLAFGPEGQALAFGTPGGDQQDQWQLVWFLHHVHHGMNLQEAIDAPLFHSQHFTGSFYPRSALPGQMMIEESVGASVISELRARGHVVNVTPEWTAGRLTAASISPDGILRAAATPRLMQAYAVGR